MKILNLYAGIGGNRKLWGDEHEITAVEYDGDIAKVYADPSIVTFQTGFHWVMLFEGFLHHPCHGKTNRSRFQRLSVQCLRDRMRQTHSS